MTTLPKRDKAFTGDRNAVLGVEEAIKQVKVNATAKFDETVEIAVNLGVDPRHAGRARIRSGRKDALSVTKSVGGGGHRNPAPRLMRLRIGRA